MSINHALPTQLSSPSTPASTPTLPRTRIPIPRTYLALVPFPSPRFPFTSNCSSFCIPRHLFLVLFIFFSLFLIPLHSLISFASSSSSSSSSFVFISCPSFFSSCFCSSPSPPRLKTPTLLHSTLIHLISSTFLFLRSCRTSRPISTNGYF